VPLLPTAITFSRIGNISAALLVEGNVRRMVSHNGTAGHIAPRIREFTYPYRGDVTILFHSDGLSAKWDMAAYPGLATSHPSLIAGILFRDQLRGRDDACVVANANGRRRRRRREIVARCR
jgi:hypothetical protein